MQDEPAAEMAVDRGIAVSVDFGKNAHATVISYPHESPPLIVEGRVDALGRIASARDASEAMQKIFDSLPRAGIYLLEEQSKINSDTPLMEAAFSALASTIPGALVIHIPVSRVANEFSLPKGRTEKKKRATAIADKFLSGTGGNLIVAPEVRTAMSKLSRKHDLADALLQTMWYVRTGKKEIARPAPGGRSRTVRATDPKNRRAEQVRKAETKKQKDRASKKLVATPKPRKRKKSSDADAKRRPPTKKPKIAGAEKPVIAKKVLDSAFFLRPVIANADSGWSKQKNFPSGRKRAKSDLYSSSDGGRSSGGDDDSYGG